MKDLSIALENRPGALAEMGEALGRAGVSVEGGGAFVVNGAGVAHFLFEDEVAARRTLEAAGIQVLEERDVVVLRLNQDEPGQLGKISRRMAEAGVNIEVLYSDHNHQLVLAVDDLAKGLEVSEAWMRERSSMRWRGRHMPHEEQKPGMPKVLAGFALACAAAAILCLVGGFLVFLLVDRPWANSVSAGLGGLFTVFALGYYAFKALILFPGRPK